MREKLTNYLPIGIVFMLSACLLTFNIGHWSFWFDESFTSALIRYDFADIISRTANDVHPPLYYLLLKAWSGIFGYSDIALRAMSAVFMFAASISMYILMRRLASNKHVALLSAFFVAVGPFVVRYSQEARMYGLAAFLLTTASLVLHIQISRKKKQRSKQMWVLYAVLIAASLYTHYFTFPIILAHWLYVVYADTKLEINRKLTLKKARAKLSKIDINWIKVNVLAAALFLPWLPTFLEQSGRVNSGFWIQGVSVTSIVDAFYQLLLFEEVKPTDSFSSIVFALVLFGLAAIGLVALWKRIERDEKANLILVFSPIVLAILVLFLYSLPPFTSSVYFVRYFASFSVLFYGSLGYIAWLIWHRVSRQAAKVFIVALSCILIGGVVQVSQGWARDYARANDGVAQLNAVLRPGDEVVTYGYWQQYDAQHYIDERFTPKSKIDEENFYGGETLLIGRDDIVIKSYDDVKPTTGTVWFISGSNEDDLQGLPEDWQFVQTFYFENDWRITRYKVN